MSNDKAAIAANIATLRAQLDEAERKQAALTMAEPKAESVETIDAQIAELTRKRATTEAEVLAEKRRKLERLPLTFFLPPNAVAAIQNGQVAGMPGMRIVESFPRIGGGA